MTSLIERIEAATENDADLFREAATIAFGQVPDEMNRFLVARAYLDAAMTLVPAGYILQFSEWDHPDLRAKGPWQAILTQAGKRNSDLWGHRCDHAKTHALAICAAAIRARGVE